MGKFFLYTSMAALAFSCQSPSSDVKKTNQTLYLNLHTEPPTLDPRKASDTTSNNIIKMCFEGLTHIGPDGEPMLAIAKEVKASPDQKTFTFYLKETTWSDGTPVTAYDFVETWKTILSPRFPSPFAYDLYIIKKARDAKEGKCSVEEIGVRVLDKYSFVVELEHSVPFFLSLVAGSSFFPIPNHVAKTHAHWADNAGPLFVSNGPFHLKEWRHYNEIIVEKNPLYWDASSVKLEKLNLAIIEDENTELSLFENNQLDWAGSPLSTLPIDALPALTQRDDLQKYAMSGTYYYIFNTKIPPFNNVNMRRAFSLAINRKEIVDNILQGGQAPAMALIPPTIWKETLSYFKDADIEEAKRLFALGLKEMNIEKSDLPQITLIYNTLLAHHKIAQAIQQQWNLVFGVKIKLDNKEWKVYLDELTTGQFQIARMGGIATFSDPTTFLDLYKYLSSGQNYSGWTSPAFTKLLEISDNTPNQAERLQILRQAEEVFINEMPVAPIYFYTGSYLKSPYVKGVRLSDLSDVDFKWAYVDGR